MSKKKKKPRKSKLTPQRSLTDSEKDELVKYINAPRARHFKRERLAHESYYDLDFQRMTILDQLKKSLTDKCIANYKFKNWVRCVTYLYSNHPLSTRGSINEIGGRFNIGTDVSEIHFPAFNALYIAEDAKTSILEKFGQTSDGNEDSALQCSFAKKQNVSIVHVKGNLHRVLDLDAKDSLKIFTELISKINHSPELVRRRNAEGLKNLQTIKDPKILLETLYDPDWRFEPRLYELPANPQIFGQIAYFAGIEAILFTSVRDGGRCLAIFPKNLSEKSYIELEPTYPPTVEVTILNVNSYEKCL